MKLSRRNVLKLTALGLAATTFDTLGGAWVPKRLLQSAPASLPSIQFDIGDFIAPAETIDGIEFRFGPVFTSLVTGRLTRNPDVNDQRVLADALTTIEAAYPFSPEGVFTFVSYGLLTSGGCPARFLTNICRGFGPPRVAMRWKRLSLLQWTLPKEGALFARRPSTCRF